MKFIEELVWILKLSDFEQTVVLRLIFAAIAGGLVGMERELKGRPAGMKTFSLVCVGATMVMITNEYIIIVPVRLTRDERSFSYRKQ